MRGAERLMVCQHNRRGPALALLLAYLWMVGVAAAAHHCFPSGSPPLGVAGAAAPEHATPGWQSDTPRTQPACLLCDQLRTARPAPAVPHYRPLLPDGHLAAQPSRLPLLPHRPQSRIQSRAPPAA